VPAWDERVSPTLADAMWRSATVVSGSRFRK
jgi:hypothetical protein